MNITVEFCILRLIYNELHNTLRLVDVSPNFPFTTSKTIRNYYFSYTSSLMSPATVDLGPHDIRNHPESIQIPQNGSPVPSPPRQIENFANARKKPLKNTN